MIIEIPERLPSWNQFYAGVSHWTRMEMKRKWAGLTLEALPAEYSMFKTPVHITVRCETKRVPSDVDNLCAKMIIDALKGKVLYDDSPAWVSGISLFSRKGNRDYTTIELTEV